MLPMPHGVIVPGGRFREAYYWDSYWVVLGLLSVGMFETARGLTEVQLPAHCHHATAAALPATPLPVDACAVSTLTSPGVSLAESAAVRGSPRLRSQRPPPLLP